MDEFQVKLNEFASSIGDSAVAVSLGVSHGGLAIVRQLGRVGIPCIAFGLSSLDFGIFSRYCLGYTITTRHWQEELLKNLILVGKVLRGKKVLFADMDKFADFIYCNYDILNEFYEWPMPRSSNTYYSLCNKALLPKAARRANVSVPRTCMLDDTESIKSWADNTRFPVAIKPLDMNAFSSRYKRKAILASDLDSLLKHARRLAAEGFQCVAQEIVPGEIGRLITIYAYRARSGQVLVSFVGRKYRQFPRDFGTASLYVPVECREAVENTRRLLCANNYHGVVDVEFKIDERDNRLKLIEVNGRIPAYASVETGTGIYLSRIMFSDLTSSDYREIMKAPLYRASKWQYVAKDIAAMLISGAGSSNLASNLALDCKGRSNVAHAVWAWDDWAPGLAFANYSICSLMGYLKTRLRRDA